MTCENDQFVCTCLKSSTIVDIAWDNLFGVDSGKIHHKQAKCQKHASKQDIEYVFFSINKFSAPVQFDFLTQIILQIMQTSTK